VDFRGFHVGFFVTPTQESRMRTFRQDLLTVREVAQRLALGTRTVWKWSRSGQLPAPVRLGNRTVRWRAAEIERFVEEMQPRF
jgi:excisionase family DNA binding protein